MRDEKEMIDEIIGFAKNDSRIKAVLLNGSRANPLAPKIIRFHDSIRRLNECNFTN
ncbi:MAG: aminoglycoside 6-adenylyltransferase [Erysipelothrix sp.]|nr:aminoglycoside 6-adenylyltransferase [Erysipelothrix sp.]